MGTSGPSLPKGGSLSSQEVEHLAQRLSALLSTVVAGVIELDLGGRFTYANPAALRMLNMTEERLIGRTAAELGISYCDESGAIMASESARQAGAGADENSAARAEIRYLRQPATNGWLESQTAPLRGASGELIGSVMSFVEVTDRFRRETAQRAGAGRMNDVLQSMTAGVVLVDADGRIEYANAAAAALSGLKPVDVIGQLVADPAWQLTDENGKVLPYDELPVPTALRERREIRGVELGVPTLKGIAAWIRVSAVPLLEADGTLRGAVVTTEDITERHALAEQLLQAQKIEAIGQLAGGIAHDFNNLLTVILGNADLALGAVAKDSAAAEDILAICEAAERGATLTRQLLTFARKQVVQPRAVYLDRLAADVESLLRRALGEDIVLQRSSDADVWPVKADPGQLEQVLVNMVINARDAMPRGGSLVIETRNRTIDANEAQAHPGIEPGDFVTLCIRDTGSGMSRDTIARIFEPFFTTKPVGSGSGLGLSICHGVIKQAQGFISVESELGEGTTFRIHLPRTDAITDPEAAVATPLAKGMGAILLVEDEDAVRTYVARALTGYGYEVHSAGTARQALALCERLKGPLDLLLTDVVMPDMSGLELARTLHARAPTLPVLYMTGYFDARNVEMRDLNVEKDLLLKPFTPMQLAQRIQRILLR
jgi:two-component system cell cycle sensor histidine kinase/response regulator CckA